MLKKRIIPILLLKDKKLVKGINFSNYKVTGLVHTCLRTYSAQDADELFIIDICDRPDSFDFLVQTLNKASSEAHVPLTVGGGINSIDQVNQLFSAGADKVLVTSAAIENPQLLTSITQKYGNQSLVVGIDYIVKENNPIVMINKGTTECNGLDIQHYCSQLNKLSVGEILLNCIPRDGMKLGYDIETAQLICRISNVPVVVASGAGNFQHIVDLFTKTSASGAACGSLFYFGDNNPIRARSYLNNKNIPMRRLK